jgi:hypothetical protein
MGAYDDSEHERREQMVGQVDMTDDDQRVDYEGRVEFDSGESTADLLDQFEQIKAATR